MKDESRKLILCVFCGLMFTLVAKADEYQIRFLNSKNIIIGNKNAVKYMRFSDNQSIVWPKNEKNVYMRLWNVTKHREEYRPPREKKLSTGTPEKEFSTKGAVATDTRLPMLDSLNFALTTAEQNIQKFEAHWIDEKYIEKKAILSRSKDGSSICLTREMLGLTEGQVCEIEIYVYKPEDGEVLWKIITVEVVPLM